MLKKALAIPGALVKVNPIIKDGVPAVLGGGGTLDKLSITPDVGSIMLTGGWEVGPGAVLEIVKKPRRVHNINSVRVRVVAEPSVEGEVYWCELRASCTHLNGAAP